MNTIWKFRLGHVHGDRYTETNHISLPPGAQVLHVHPQSEGQEQESIQMWVLLDKDIPKDHWVSREFRIFGTGHPIKIPTERLVHIATFPFVKWLVFHAFEVLSETTEANKL